MLLVWYTSSYHNCLTVLQFHAEYAGQMSTLFALLCKQHSSLKWPWKLLKGLLKLWHVTLCYASCSLPVWVSTTFAFLGGKSTSLIEFWRCGQAKVAGTLREILENGWNMFSLEYFDIFRCDSDHLTIPSFASFDNQDERSYARDLYSVGRGLGTMSTEAVNMKI